MNEEQLKKYIENQLSDIEKNQLEQLCADNSFLDEALDGLTEWRSKSSVTYDELQDKLHTEINKIKLNSKTQRMEPKPSSFIRMPIFRVIATAASIVGILFFSTHYLFEKRKSAEKIYALHFKVLTHPDGVVRGEDTVAENNFTRKAIAYYEQENYKKAIEFYQKALAQQPKNEKNILFLAISYLANFQPEEAIEVLDNADTDEQKHLNDRHWYLAMAYLKIKDIDNAKNYLKMLSISNSYYTENATAILKQLGDDDITVQK